MKNRLTKPPIEIRYSPISGYGVFATKKFNKNEIIEECPILLLDEIPSKLRNHTFAWNNHPFNVLALGYGSLYKHASLPNAEWKQDEENQLITFKALKPICKDEEIFTYYTSTWPSSPKIKQKLLDNYLPKNLPLFLGRLGLILLAFFIFKIALFPPQQLSNTPPRSFGHRKSLS